MKGERSLVDIFREFISKDADFNIAKELVFRNSEGKRWLIGGYLYRSLAYLICGHSKSEAVDFDFIVEKINEEIILSAGFELRENRYGNPKFVKEKISVDIVPLATVHSIRRRGLEPTIENYLTGTPLTIQSIAYDLDNGNLIGNTGIRALLCQEVGINNLSQAKIYAGKKGLSIEDIVKRKAESLRFKAIIPQ